MGLTELADWVACVKRRNKVRIRGSVTALTVEKSMHDEIGEGMVCWGE